MASRSHGSSRVEQTPPVGAGEAAVATVSADGIITSWSTGAQCLLGYPPADVVGRPAASLLTTDGSAWDHATWPADRSGEVVARHSDGRAVRLMLTWYPTPGGSSGQSWLFLARPVVGGEFCGGEAGLLGRAIDSAGIALAVYDRDLRCVWMSDAKRALLDLPDGDLRGRRLTEIRADPVYADIEERIRSVLATGRTRTRQTRHVAGKTLRHNAWSITLSPLNDDRGRVQAVCATIQDITEQYWARKWLSLLSEAGTRIGTTLDMTTTARELADMVVPQLADFVTVEMLDTVFLGGEPSSSLPSGPIVLRRMAQRALVEGVPPAAIEVGNTDSYPDFSPPTRCLATGRTVRSGMDDPDFLRWMSETSRRTDAIRKHGIHSSVAVPLRPRGTNLGVLVGYRYRPEPFADSHQMVMEELAARAAIAIDNARRYRRERAIAMTLQRSLLPRDLPDQPAVEVATRYLPSDQTVGVGGDWFDVIRLSGARIGLVVGDIVGHGVYASATMGRLKTAVRTLAEVDLPPDELLTYLDELVAKLRPEMAWDEVGQADAAGVDPGDIGATCLYAVYDPISRRCDFARAGHPPPALLLPDGSARLLDVPAGTPLGLGGLPYESADVELPENSLLVMFTDGLVESRDLDIDSGFERLLDALNHASPSLRDTCDRILTSTLRGRVIDDVALLVARTHCLTPDHVAEWDVPRDPAAVADVRNQALRCLHDWKLDDLAYTTELVVSELVTNAIRHGGSDIQLRLIRDGNLICEVSDGSNTAPHLRRARAFDEGGRGLMLVAQLTRHWGTRQCSSGKTIWAEQAIDKR